MSADPHPYGDRVSIGRTPSAIRAALDPEQRDQFDREYEQLITVWWARAAATHDPAAADADALEARLATGSDPGATVPSKSWPDGAGLRRERVGG